MSTASSDARPAAAPLKRAALALALLALTAGGVADAQTQRSGNDAARVMQQLQQVTAEKLALAADKAKLEQENADLKAKLAAASAAPKDTGAARRAVQAEAKERETAAELERVRAQTQELVGRFRETAQTLKEVEIDRSTLRGQLSMREREYSTCVDRNVGLYELNGELLSRLERRRAAANEPFFQVSRARLENLIDDYRYRVEELRVQRAADSSTTTRKQ
jgi:hypothetical protein